MNAVNVQIDIDNPIGLRLLHELEKHPDVAKVDYSVSEQPIAKTYTHDEVFDECYEILNEHYKCDVRKL